MSAVLATGDKDSVAADAQYPAYREELVSTLLETLLQHPRLARLSQQAAAADAASTTGGSVAAAGGGSAVETRPGTPGAGGAWEELQTAVQEVAAAQRTAELTEWLGCAKIALQVHKCSASSSSPQVLVPSPHAEHVNTVGKIQQAGALSIELDSCCS